MYSIALLVALSTSADAAACHRGCGRSCGGCYSGGYGGCYGGYGGGCYGGYGGCYGGYGGYACVGYGMPYYGASYGPDVARGETQEQFEFCQEEGKKMTPTDYAGFRSKWLNMSSAERDKMIADKKKKKDDKDMEVSAPATITVSLPADAVLFVDDKPTTSASAERTFVSPELQPGKEYYYTFKVEVMRDGKKTVMEKRVDVMAGKEIKVKFEDGSAKVVSR
jgi:uncharacterized protein (TIGR03000 family)